jgi:ATP-binding cassette subfamily D (ALD) protein 3
VLDLVLFTRKLSTTMGYQGPFIMMGWFFVSGLLMRYMSPAFGKLTAIEQSNLYYYNNYFSFGRRL